MTYIVTVEWGDSQGWPHLTKSYEIQADSPRAAISLWKKEWGYNPGVPINARPKEIGNV